MLGDGYVLLDVDRVALDLLLVEVARSHHALDGLALHLSHLVDGVVEGLAVAHQLCNICNFASRYIEAGSQLVVLPFLFLGLGASSPALAGGTVALLDHLEVFVHVRGVLASQLRPNGCPLVVGEGLRPNALLRLVADQRVQA